MRPIEMLLTVANMFTFLGVAVPRLRTNRWSGYFVLIMLTGAVVQICLEGVRWQMVFAYALTGLFLIIWGAQRVTAAKREGSTSRSFPTESSPVGLPFSASLV
jgi:uncharacterized membrane protein YhaH (DUF805 family)